MTKTLKITGIIVILLLFLQQCTTVNLIPAFVSNKDDYKYISDIIDSDEWNIDQITNNRYAYITYDTINNYFIVDDSYSKSKIDSNGKVLKRISHPSGEIPYKTHYVFTDSTVWDFSKTNLAFESYQKTINPEVDILEKNWILIFEEYYNAAQIVIYGDDVIYMKIKEDWILMYLDDNYFLRGDNISERSFDGYPAKKDSALIFLRESETGIYSDWSSRIGSLDQRNYDENKLKYTTETIDQISYSKVKESDRLAYINIIARFVGDGYYQLKKGDNYLKFIENTFNTPFIFFKTENYFEHFVLPKSFDSKTDISFVKCICSKNQTTNSFDGIYLIHYKK